MAMRYDPYGKPIPVAPSAVKKGNVMPTTTKPKTAGRTGTATQKAPGIVAGPAPLPSAPTPAPVPNPNPTALSGDPRNIGGASAINAASAAPAGTPTPGASQYTPTGTDPVQGFAGRYPTGQLGQLFQQPGILAEDVLKSMGIGTNKQLIGNYGAVSQYAPILAEIFTALSGNTGMEAGVNTMADYMKNMATPGGRGLDSGELMRAILNPAAGSDFANLFGQTDQYGNPLSASDVMSLLKPYLQGAMSGDTPLHQQAMLARLQSDANNFNAQVARGQNPVGTNFLNYMAKSGAYY